MIPQKVKSGQDLGLTLQLDAHYACLEVVDFDLLAQPIHSFVVERALVDTRLIGESIGGRAQVAPALGVAVQTPCRTRHAVPLFVGYGAFGTLDHTVAIVLVKRAWTLEETLVLEEDVS